MAANVRAKKSKFTKNKKKSWKNIDITEVEDSLEDERLQERTGGLVAEKTDAELFQVDKVKRDILNTDKVTPRKNRKREAKALKCYANLEPDPRIKALRLPHNKKKKSFETTEVEKLSKKINDDKKATKIRDRNRKSARTLKRELPIATYDLWSDTDRNNNEDPHYMEVTKKKRFAPPKHYNKRPSEQNAVEVPHPGASYNPTYEDHQELLMKAHEIEVKKDRKERKLYNALEAKFKTLKPGELEANLMAEMAAGLGVEEGEEDIEFTPEELDKISVNPPVRREDKKTKTQRNKEARQKQMNKLKMKDKIHKKKTNQMFRLKSIKAEIIEEEQEKVRKEKLRAEKKEQEKFATRKLGKMKFEEPNLELKLSEELEGSLRLLKPEGHLLEDRFKSLQKRNILEPRGIAKKTRKYKPKSYEKKGHKAIGIGTTGLG